MSVLSGRHVVVTRPPGQADTLARAICNAGGEAVLFPALDILEADDQAPLAAAAQRLAAGEYSLVFFVSVNAIERALPHLPPASGWPITTRLAAVGPSSEAALAAAGYRGVIAPQTRFDSEALLELPALQQVSGWRVLVLRGDGGRALFADTLRQRGAEVEQVACYRRVVPAITPEPLFDLWRKGQLDAITVTSSEGLANLFAMLGESGVGLLRETPMFVPHARIAMLARQRGVLQVVETPPADQGLLSGLCDHFSAAGQSPAL